MHYYSHNIKDYRKDTIHLSLLEHGIYRQLLDTYYMDEKPLTLDHADLMRTHCVCNADAMRAFENVLKDFFFRTDEGYKHGRCDAEIAKFHAKSEKAKKAAKARWEKEMKEKGGGKKKKSMRTHSECNAKAMLTNSVYTTTTTKDIGGGEVIGKPASAEKTPHRTTENLKRATQISAKLTDAGVQGASENRAEVIGWAGNPKVTDALLGELIALVRRRKPGQSVNVAYLTPMITDLLNPPPPREDRPQAVSRNLSAEETAQEARALGLEARIGESTEALRSRINDKKRNPAVTRAGLTEVKKILAESFGVSP